MALNGKTAYKARNNIPLTLDKYFDGLEVMDCTPKTGIQSQLIGGCIE
jgi:hypothetical protein